MSLLPGQIIPATMPLGTVNANGQVIIDKNWWLYLYNLGANSTSPPSGGLNMTPADEFLLTEIDGATVVNEGGGGVSLPLTTAGDLLYENAALIPARLGIGVPGNILTVSSSSLPQWSMNLENPAPFIMPGYTNAGPFIKIVKFAGLYVALLSTPGTVSTKNGFIFTSSNLKTWTLAYSSLLYTCYDLVILGSYLVILGNSSSDNFFEYTSDAVTWTKSAILSGGPTSIKYAWYQGGDYCFSDGTISSVYVGTSLSGSFVHLSIATSGLPTSPSSLLEPIFSYGGSWWCLTYAASGGTLAIYKSTSGWSSGYSLAASVASDPFASGLSYSVKQWYPHSLVDNSGNLLCHALYSNGTEYNIVFCTLPLGSPSSGFSYPCMSYYNGINSTIVEAPGLAYDSTRGFLVIDPGGYVYSAPANNINSWSVYPQLLPNYGTSNTNVTQMTVYSIWNDSGVFRVASGLGLPNAKTSPIVWSL